MINWEVFLDGKKITIDTLERWDDIDTLFRTYFRLTAASQPESTPITEMVSVSPEETTTPVKYLQNERDFPTEAVGKSWTERAWLTINRPATNEEMYNAAVALGFRSNAMNPLSAFKRAIRDNPSFVRVGATDTKAFLWVLKNNNSQDITPFVSEKKTIMRVGKGNNSPLIPVPGQQTADFAEAVLKRVQHGLPIATLTQEMMADNWTSTSSTQQKRERAVEVALYRSRDRFVKRDGAWQLAKWSVEQTQQENPSLSGFDDMTDSKDTM